jgi:hypothetical protein
MATLIISSLRDRPNIFYSRSVEYCIADAAAEDLQKLTISIGNKQHVDTFDLFKFWAVGEACR